MWYLTEGRQAILDTVREFVRTEVAPQALEIDATHEFPLALFKRAGELGLLGVTVPEEFGGLGADQTTSALIYEEIATAMPVLTIAMGAHSFLAGGLIEMLGSVEQKKTYLVPAAAGEIIMACGSTEAVGGDNQVEFATRAVLDGDEWVLNGGKVLICNTGVADLYVVVAVTADHVDPVTKAGLSAFLVPAGTPGLGIGKPEHKLGWHGSATGSLSFTDCRIPRENLLGPLDGCLQAMFVSATTEFLSCGPVSLGIAEGAYRMALAYSLERTQQGQSMFDRFQVTRHKLARMYGEIESLRALVYSTYAERDRGQLCLAQGRLLKIKGAEVSEYVAREAIQLFGGVGTVVETGVERYWRDAKVMAIGGASVEALNDVVAGLIKRNLA
ncbi:acyl-CoA dehydrogenase family protein [Actinotalea subterranea]|uniref:acyl-CoA dehydrogenase family protein n=1 Tax=Actinotalea subterranea TaxID=2607497 RepID=UPI0011EECBE5|nr:acyl-CoA dehydrogenase family protein [Actinotalea subterranea]